MRFKVPSVLWHFHAFGKGLTPEKVDWVN